MADTFADLLSAGSDPRNAGMAVAASQDGIGIPKASALSTGVTNRSDDESSRGSGNELHEGDILAHVEPETPEEYAETKAHESTFGEVNDDDLAVSEDDVDSIDITSDEPEKANTPSPSIQADSTHVATDQSATPAWMGVVPNSSTETDEDSGAAALGLETPSFDDDFPDDDDNYDIRPNKSKFGGFDFGSMFAPVTNLFEKHPQWKRPAIFGAGGIAVALVLALFFGGSPASDTPKEPPIAAEEPQAEEPVGGQEITLLPKAVSASCPPGGTSPTLAFTTKPEEAWICGRANGIDGAIMNIQFAKTVIVKSVTVMPGWNYVAPNGKDNWNEHRLVTKILWRIGGKQFVQNINPTRSGATLTLPGNGMATTVMSLTIQKTEVPSATNAESVPGSGDGNEGGMLPPLPGVGDVQGAPNKDVDATTAIGSVTITGVET